MTRFLFTPLPELGHVRPIAEAARKLAELGHDVILYVTDEIRKVLERDALPVRYSICPPSPNTSLARVPWPKVRQIRTVAWHRAQLITTCTLGLKNVYIDVLRDTLRDVAPDIIVVDPQNWVSALLANETGRPWACVGTGLYSVAPRDLHCTVLDAMERNAAAIAELYPGVKIVRCNVESPWLNTVFTTERFAPRDEAGDSARDVVYVGPALPPAAVSDGFPWERLRPDRRLVYVAFGSRYTPPVEAYEALVAALDPEREQAVLALGDLVDEPFVRSFPEHVIGVRWAPQTELLRRASVFVTHGGANSVTESLVCGTPLIVMPLVYDQPIQAALVAARGVGAVLDVETVTPAEYRSALDRLASDPAVRASVDAMQASFLEADGSKGVAECLLELAATVS